MKVNSNEKNNKQISVLQVIGFGLIACILYGLGAGLRSDIGILLNPLADHCGLKYEDVSICIAAMQLVFGAIQPFFGILASKKSNRFVLLLGIGLLGVSLTGMMLSSRFLGLFVSLGILFGLGAGALAFGLVLTSAIRFVGRDRAMIISGMLNAAAGMMGFILSPLMQSLLSFRGLSFALVCLLCGLVLLIPITFFVTSKDGRGLDEENEEEGNEISGTTKELLREALHNRTYRLLLAGFTTCGFHMVIIESHLFSQYVLYGVSEKAASWAFSVYGIATIAGALLSGFLSMRISKGRLLGFYYGFRAVWVLIYLFLLPKNIITAVLFSVGLGMTGDATVSPTSGLVGENFNISQVATLIGLLFLAHQIGAFFSAWLGGALLSWTGNYIMIWLIDIILCVFASIMSMRISSKE